MVKKVVGDPAPLDSYHVKDCKLMSIPIGSENPNDLAALDSFQRVFQSKINSNLRDMKMLKHKGKRKKYQHVVASTSMSRHLILPLISLQKVVDLLCKVRILLNYLHSPVGI